MNKILVVFGTRPEAIKMCPLVLELKKRKNLDVRVCVTGQHRHMLDQILHDFNVVPDYDLNIMKKSQNLFDITTAILTKFQVVLKSENPDVCLVHGDTSTSYVVSVACFYANVAVGHVEAGLRTWNMKSPYPEEFNRQSIGLIASYHFAPTELAKRNLIEEGKSENSVYVTGNTVVDAMKFTVKHNYRHSELNWVGSSKLLLLTAHRRENIGMPMVNIFTAIKTIANEYEDIKVIYPIHLNPAVRNIANNIFNNCKNIHLIEPLDVLDFHNFEARCYLCLTDSGGLQEECPTFGKPVLVLRDTTERPEGIEAGTSRLVGTDFHSVYSNIKLLLDSKDEYNKMSNSCNPYGDGHACERIADILENILVNNQ